MKKSLKRMKFREFKSIYSRVPRLCADVIILTPRGIVLTKRKIEPAKGQWHIPGATLLMGERLEQTAKRVAKEELGITIEIIGMLGVIEYSFKNYFSQPVAIEYLAKAHVTKMRVNSDASEAAFFKTIPKNTITIQKKFLQKHLGLRVGRAVY